MSRIVSVAAIVFLAVAVHSGFAFAVVFKCAAPGGKIVYQDMACDGKELRNFDTDPPTLSIVPGGAPNATGNSPARGAPTQSGRDEPRAGASTKSSRKSDRGNGGQVPADGQSDNRQAAERKFIRAGMSEAEVLHKIGRPNVSSTAQNKRSKQWSYLPASGDPMAITTVTLAGGSVTNVERKVVR